MKRGEKMAAVETPQDEIEQLREDLAEHATHLDLLQQNADSQRTNWAADRMRLNALAQEVKELRENAAADRLLIRNNAEQVEEAIDAMKYRRMVGNLFRRVADLVDGG